MNLLKELLQEQLFESASSVLYHFTSLENAAKIISSGIFKLSNVLSDRNMV
jgi:RNA:NAD 2'-phosphotransferase (TPT1/KptA family)